MEITPRIHSIPAPIESGFYTGPQAPNVYLVADGGEGALIDSGFGDEQSVRARLDYLRERPEIKLRYIVLTHHHFDHSSGAHQLRQATGAEIVMHTQEERFLRDWQGDVPQDIDVPAGHEAVAEQVRRFRRQAAEATPDAAIADGAMLNVGGLTLESEREWYNEMRGDPAQVLWCIETEEGQLIGNLGLHAIDEAQGRATLGIVICEKDFWSRGYGTEAIRQVLRYAFTELGLRRVDLHVDEDNLRGIRCYEKCGFVREGLLRAYRVRRGQPVASVAMAVLREDWEA